MEGLISGTAVALWLGILTSLSPCPLATNIAAISFISRKIKRTRYIILSGLLYTIGRMATYTILGILIITSVLSIPGISYFLQKYMHRVLGPILILAGMVILEFIPLNLPGLVGGERTQRRIENMGHVGAFLLGILFALAFCPVSAALFFGSLIPLALATRSHFLLPGIYGVGTGLPVIVFAFILGKGTQATAKAFNRLGTFEIWMRRLTGVVFILLGIWFCLRYIFHLF